MRLKDLTGALARIGAVAPPAALAGVAPSAACAGGPGGSRSGPDTPAPPTAPHSGSEAAAPVRRIGLRALHRALREDPGALLPDEALRLPRVDLRVAGRRCAAISDPAVARAMLSAPETDLKMSPMQRRLLSPALGGGLVLAEGEAARRGRRLAMSLARVPSTEALARADARAEAFAAHWLALPPGEDPTPLMMACALDLLAIAIFDHDAVANGSRVATLMAHQRHMERVELLDALGAPEAWRSPRRRAMTVRLRRHDGEIVAAARAAGLEARLAARAGEDAQGESALRDFVVSMLSGYATTALSAFWTLARLADAPAALAAARAAPARDFSEAAIFGGTALERAAAEAMRLHPPFPFLFRQAVRDLDAPGGRIARGDLVLIAPYAIHRHEACWDAPKAFRPDRFAADPGPAYLPFGHGRRRCIGMQLGFHLSTLMARKALEAGVPVIAGAKGVGMRSGLTLRPLRPAALRLIPAEGAA